MMMEKELGSTDRNQSSDDAADEIQMNRTFCAILYKAHPTLAGPVIVWCVMGYVLIIDDTTDRKVYTAEQCEGRSEKFLRFVNNLLSGKSS